MKRIAIRWRAREICVPILGCNRVCEPGTLSTCEVAKHASCIAKNVPAETIAKTIGAATVLAGPVGQVISLVFLDKTAQEVEKARKTLPPVTIPNLQPVPGPSRTTQSDCIVTVNASPNASYVVYTSGKPELINQLTLNDLLVATSKNPAASCGLTDGMSPVASSSGQVQQIINQTIYVNGQETSAWIIMIYKWN